MDLEVALDKLEGLGSPDAIAKFFEAEGIKGIMRFGESCPVTKYLIREVDIINGEYVHSTYIDVVITRNDEDLIKSVRMNEAVRTFIARFDNGMYPNLEYKDN